MSPTDEIQDVCGKMARVRANMGDEVETFVQSTRVLLDWRHYMSQAPWICLAGAAIVGYLAVPAKARPAPATPTFRSRERKSDEESKVARASLTASILDLAGPLVWQVGRTLITRQINQFLSSRASGNSPRTKPKDVTP